MGSLQFVERVRAHDAPTQAQKLRLATSWRRPLIYSTALMRRRAGIVPQTGHAASAIGRGYTSSHYRGSWGLIDVATSFAPRADRMFGCSAVVRVCRVWRRPQDPGRRARPHIGHRSEAHTSEL